MQRRQHVMTTTDSRRGLDPALIKRTLAAVASLGLIAVACGNDETASSDTTIETPSPDQSATADTTIDTPQQSAQAKHPPQGFA